MVPTLVENSKFLCTCLLTSFVNNYYDDSELTYTTSEIAPHTPALLIVTELGKSPLWAHC